MNTYNYTLQSVCFHLLILIHMINIIMYSLTLFCTTTTLEVQLFNYYYYYYIILPHLL